MAEPEILKLPLSEGGDSLEAHLAIPAGARPGPLPAVLICHAFRGQGDFERARAERLARELGVIGAAIDLYGKGVFGRDVAESSRLMAPFLADRGRLRSRLVAWTAAIAAHPRVEPGRLAAIGFCFGGLCALDLARAGAELRGVVSFHGLFAAPEGLSIGPFRAKVLVLHGHDDPMATPEQLLALESELGRHGADWEVHVYGATKHAFTNPAASDEARGTVYSERADRRSWIAMRAFLDEALDLKP